jgi:hypothetical protein
VLSSPVIPEVQISNRRTDLFDAAHRPVFENFATGRVVGLVAAFTPSSIVDLLFAAPTYFKSLLRAQTAGLGRTKI